MVSSSPRRQGGLALLMAILVVIIATTIAVNIVHEEKFTIRKSTHVLLMDRAGLYAFGLEDWAQIYLREDREDSDIDSLDEYWATGIPGLPIEGGYLTGYLEDEQARFNINTLVGSEIAVTRFRRLCDNLGVDDSFIPALMDWIDVDFDIRYPDGMEENYETYRVANREIVDISELMLLDKVDQELFEKLKPHITALPTPTTLNVNTMSTEIFESLGENLDASQFIEERENDPYDSIEDFIERLQLPVNIEGLSADTHFFRAHGQVMQGELVFNMTSLVYRDDKGKTVVIHRTLGQF